MKSSIEMKGKMEPMNDFEPPAAAADGESHLNGRIVGSPSAVQPPKAITRNTVLTAITPVLQLIIGWRYADECPINPKIPTYLVVAGAVGIVNAIFSDIYSHLTTRAAQSSHEELDGNNEVTTTHKRSSPIMAAFVAFNCLMSIFLFIWIICGCVWIFSVWSEVQFVRADQLTYCSPVAYRFAYLLLMIPLLCLLCCCPLCIASAALIGVAMSKR